MKLRISIAFISALMSISLVGCMEPNTFVKGQASGWKAIEFNDQTKGNYDVAWQKTVDTIAKNYDIEMMDKQSGYLRTGWTYGISGGEMNRYRGRITVKFPTIDKPDKLELKTEAEWLSDMYYGGMWVPGWDQSFQRDAYNALSGRLGRTVSNE